MRSMSLASSSTSRTSGPQMPPESLYIFWGRPVVKTMKFHALAAGTVICGLISFFLDVLTYTYFEQPNIGTFWYSIPCILCMSVAFWSSSNLHVQIATGIGLVGVGMALYASIVDISSSEIIFNILICRNFKGEIFGELSNSDAITANMQSCDDKLATGEHDLYCTTKAADYCYVFDGTDDGSVVLDDFGPLLEVAIAFKALVLFGVCVYTFIALFAIIDLHYFSMNKVYIEDEGAEMQWVSREEKMDNSSVNSKRNKSSSKPVSNAELLGY